MLLALLFTVSGAIQFPLCLPLPSPLFCFDHLLHKTTYRCKIWSLKHVSFLRYSDYGRPVVVTDATRNWTAQHVFNFRFLKSLYQEQLLEHNPHGCQLHSTSAPGADLAEVFNDSQPFRRHARPWHIGW